MKHYIDIRLRPDPEFAPPVLLNAVYAKLHKALVQLGASGIGVSFPAHGKKTVKGKSVPHLGDVLRLHGSASDLAALQATALLGALHEQVQASPVTAAPATAPHCSVRRVQAQTNPERVQRRLVKRLMQREGLDQAQAQARICATAAPKLEQPFITLQSSSTGQRFRLFISQGTPQPQAQAGVFNAYGLSSTATVPWF